MNATKISALLVNRPASLAVVPQKNFTKVDNGQGCKAYIKEATKAGEVKKVHLSGFGYNGLPKELALPQAAYKAMPDNGAVSVEVDLDAAGEQWFAKLLEVLPSLKAEEDTRRQGRRGRRGTGAGAPKLAELLAKATAEQAATQAKAEASTDQVIEAKADEESESIPSDIWTGGDEDEESDEDEGDEDISDDE